MILYIYLVKCLYLNLYCVSIADFIMEFQKNAKVIKFEDDINSQLYLTMVENYEIPMKNDTQNKEEFLNEKTIDGIEKSGFKSTIIPISNLNQEIQISPYKIYDCEACSKVFCTRKKLEAHKFTVHDSEEILKTFDLNNDSESITDIKVSKRNYKISYVDRDSKVLTNTNVKNNMFNKCEEIQTKPSSIFVPKEIHVSYNDDKDNNDMEMCEICNKFFKSNDALRSHRYQYHGDRHHIYSRSPKGNENVTLCNICQFPCASEKSLWIHLHRKHPELEEKENQDLNEELVQNTPKNKTKEPLSKTIDSPSNPGLGVSLVINKKVLKSVLTEQTQHERISRRTSMQLEFSPYKIYKSRSTHCSNLRFQVKFSPISRTYIF